MNRSASNVITVPNGPVYDLLIILQCFRKYYYISFIPKSLTSFLLQLNQVLRLSKPLLLQKQHLMPPEKRISSSWHSGLVLDQSEDQYLLNCKLIQKRDSQFDLLTRNKREIISQISASFFQTDAIFVQRNCLPFVFRRGRTETTTHKFGNGLVLLSQTVMVEVGKSFCICYGNTFLMQQCF